MSDEADPIGSAGSNDTVRANLDKHGDKGTAPRDVEHFCYAHPDVTEPVSIDDFQTALAQRGFDVERLEGEGATWLKFAHFDAVAGAGFDRLTGQIADELAEAGWVYDGWSCDVLPAGKGA